MSTIDTISELITLSGSQFRVYDIGRRIDKISKSDFEKIEQNQLPYPFPLQGNAHLALAFWQKDTKTPYIWFVKLPLDERGLLNQGARNHFIAIIVEALGNDLTIDPTEKQEELLKSNPYNFTPAQYKLASLNAKLQVELKHNASSFYEHAQLYFSGKLGWSDWQSVGVQGIADFSARVSDKENHQALLLALPHLPMQVFSVLCSALENETLNIEVIDLLIERFKQAKSLEERQYSLRALAKNADHPHIIKLVTSILDCPEPEVEIIIILSGRCWQALASNEIMMNYLDQVANTHDSNLFAAIFKDIVSIPLLRPIVLNCMRSEDRSNTLAAQIGTLFSQTKQH